MAQHPKASHADHEPDEQHYRNDYGGLGQANKPANGSLKEANEHVSSPVPSQSEFFKGKQFHQTPARSLALLRIEAASRPVEIETSLS